jgi:hypothetical protein
MLKYYRIPYRYSVCSTMMVPAQNGDAAQKKAERMLKDQIRYRLGDILEGDERKAVMDSITFGVVTDADEVPS